VPTARVSDRADGLAPTAWRSLRCARTRWRARDGAAEAFLHCNYRAQAVNADSVVLDARAAAIAAATGA